MTYKPPRYLTAVPPTEWFLERFGACWAIAELSWIKRAQLVRACEAQRWRCCYCQASIDIPEGLPSPHEATREHVRPKSAQGSDEDENIVAACMLCNSSRGVMDPFAFRPRFGSEANVRLFA